MSTGGGGGGAGVSVNETTTVRAPLIAGVDIFENAPGAAVTVKTARSVLSATAMVTPLPLSRAIRVSMSGFRSSNVALPSAMAASGTRIVVPASSGPDVWIVDLTRSPCRSNTMSSTIGGNGAGAVVGAVVVAVVGRVVASGSPEPTSTTASTMPASTRRTASPARSARRRLREGSGRTGVVGGVGRTGGGAAVLSSRVAMSREPGAAAGSGVVASATAPFADSGPMSLASRRQRGPSSVITISSSSSHASAAPRGRSAGSFSSIRSSHRARRSSRSGLSDLGGGIGSWICFTSTAMGVSRSSNGRRPTSSS